MKLALRMVGVSVVALMLGMVLGVRSAYAATSTWTGAGGDTKFSTDANWDVPPAQDGTDELVFPTAATGSHLPNNDLTDKTFVSITFSGNFNVMNYTVSGNSMTITGGITTSGSADPRITAPLVLTGDQTITLDTSSGLAIDSVVSGTANITKAGAGSLTLQKANTFTGTVTVNAGSVYLWDPTSLGTSAGGTIVSDGAYVSFYLYEEDKTATITEPFTLNGLSQYDDAQLIVEASCGYRNCSDSDFTLSGAITLGADTALNSSGTVRLTGAITGSHHINVISGNYITLVVNSSANGSLTPNGTYETTPVTTSYSANAPSDDIRAYKYQTAILANGTYRYGSVGRLGVLKGAGSIVQSLYVGEGGIVAPGMSPGCISAGGSVSVYGEYQAEIGGTTACTGYDQLSATTYVYVTDGTLTTSLINGYVPKQGDVFTILDNKGTDPVDGEFSGLTEGTTFKVGDVVFKISYKGGDGNDITLTAVTVPALPKTGFAMLANVFALKLITGLATIGLVLFGAFKYGRRA